MKEIEAARKKLYPNGFKTSGAFKKWALGHAEYSAYRVNHSTMWCSRCGETFGHDCRLVNNPDLGGDQYAICPHCGQRLRLSHSRNTKDRVINYFQELTACGRYQIIRTYCLDAQCKKNEEVKYQLIPVVEWWFAEDGFYQLYRAGLAGYSLYRANPWRMDSEMRNCGNRINEWSSGWKISAVYPKRNIQPWLRRTEAMSVVGKYDMTNILLKLNRSESHLETLFKWGNKELVSSYLRGWEKYMWASIKVAWRHGWREFSDEWFDYVRMLRNEGRDVRNPKILCLSGFREEHDKLVQLAAKRRAEAEKRANKAKLKQLYEDDMEYQRRIAPMMALNFESGSMTIAPLKDLREFAQVGEKQHICIFSAGYFRRENSLIFGVWDDGKYVATVEYNLNDYRVMQFRGPYNQISPYADVAISLIESHENQIKQARQKQLKIITNGKAV